MKFATLHDVARTAGVSYATVDRVINKRGSVAEKTIARVQEAIATLGYERNETAANLVKRRVYRFHFLLPDEENDFFSALCTAVEAQQAKSNQLRSHCEISRVPAFSEAALIEVLDKIDASETDCLCAVALDTPDVIAAFERVKERGVKVVTLVSDLAASQRDYYVGIDNLVAGKTAGRMMGLAHSQRVGQVLPIIGASRAYDHAQRLDGFRQIFSRHVPSVTLLDPVKSGDDAAVVAKVAAQAWAAHPDLTGIYNIGAGSEGLIHWAQSIAAPMRPVIVVHELLPASRAALEAGLIDAVIDQKPLEAVCEALRVMRRLVDGRSIKQAATLITPAIYLCENLPET